MIDNELTSMVINASIEIHRALGPGLLESAYRECLYYELQLRGLKVVKEKPVSIVYKGVTLDHGYRIDLLVEDRLVVELKTVECFSESHYQQVITYLKLGNYPYGLLINFDEVLLKNGLKRFVNT